MLSRGPRPLVYSVCKGATTANFAAGAATPRGRFFVICGAFFGPVGTPETSRDTPGTPEPPGAIFHRFCVVPGQAFGRFGTALGSLWLPLAPLLRTEGDKKREKRHSGTRARPHGGCSENGRPWDL